jgi:hypothetical protein
VSSIDYAWSISTTAKGGNQKHGLCTTSTISGDRNLTPDDGTRSHSNVIRLRARRVQLEVFLTGTSPEVFRVHLATLLRSPLGVSISRTHELHDKVRVHFNIAPEDVDFTLHTLIATLSGATIGTLRASASKGDLRSGLAMAVQ